MKRLKSNLLIIFILINILFIGFFPIHTLAQSDLSFTFDDNIIFDNSITEFNNSYNLKNSAQFTEHYNATYSFENEIDGTSGSNIDFIDSNSTGIDSTLQIISNQNGHNKVIEIFDNDTLVRVEGISNFPEHSFGTIELFIRGNDVSNQIDFRIRDGNDDGPFIFLSSDFLKYFDGSSHNIIGISDNTWYHIRIDFECGNDGYQGLASDTYFVYLNNERFGPFPFDDLLESVDSIRFLTNNAQLNYFYYLDAIGFFLENFNFEGFNENIIGKEPLLWSVQSFGTGIGTIERFQGSNVLRVFDDDINEDVQVSTNLFQSIDQSIEYYIAINDTSLTEWYFMSFNEGGSGKISLRIDNNDLDFNDGIGWFSVKDDFIINDTWFKITLKLDDSANIFDIFIDNSLEGNDLDYFSNSVISIDSLTFTSDGVQTSITYLDNFSINSTNFNNYFLSQNLIPFLNVSQTLQEVNRYEFALNAPNSFNPQGTDNPNGWTDIEDLVGDFVNIVFDAGHPFNAFVQAGETSVLNSRMGIEKDNLGITGSNFINVSFGVSIDTLSNINNLLSCEIFSTDTSLISSVIFDGSLNIFFNGIDTNIDGIPFSLYEINVLINYEIDQTFLTISNESGFLIFINQTTPFLGKSGLKEVRIVSDNIAGTPIKYFIDYIGIYNNGISQVNSGLDFGIAQIDLELSTWNFQNNNLINIIGNGTFHLGVIQGTYSRTSSFNFIRQTSIYNNLSQLINMYDGTTTPISNPTFLITIQGRFFDTSNLKIDGVVLNESTNSYNLIFEHGNIDSNESFFSVVGSELLFTHTANDTNLEFIQARFNINDVSSNGLLTSFKSVITNNAFGFLRINFTDDSNLVQIPNIESTTRFILAQNLTIRDIVVLITDRNINTITGTSIGSISQIQFLVTENITISVLITSLITMIIPLLMILIPSLAVSKIYGNIFIIPLFLLMSVICVASSLIPLWLFFIIAFSSSLFLTKREKGMI